LDFICSLKISLGSYRPSPNLEVCRRNLHMLYYFVVAVLDVSIFVLDLTRSAKCGTKSSVVVIIAQHVQLQNRSPA
jgi:hypothetical protein